MSKFKSYTEETRKTWGTSDDRPLSLKQINTGCLLRIADAAEKMAARYQELIDERDKYKRWYEEAWERGGHLERRISSLMGVITRMKRKEGL